MMAPIPEHLRYLIDNNDPGPGGIVVVVRPEDILGGLFTAFVWPYPQGWYQFSLTTTLN